MDNTTGTIILLTFLVVILVAIVAFCLVIIFKDRIVNSWRRRVHRKKNKQAMNVDLSYFINNLSSSLAKLSFDKTGALIILENENNLQKYIDAGKKVNIDFFPEFVTNVFYNHKSPLHDGAMIIRDLKIVSLSSYLPMTKKPLPIYYGARHRAAVGVCEYFDCFAFCVSETTGAVTYVHNDSIKQLSSSPEELAEFIAKELWSKSIYKKEFK